MYTLIVYTGNETQAQRQDYAQGWDITRSETFTINGKQGEELITSKFRNSARNCLGISEVAWRWLHECLGLESDSELARVCQQMSCECYGI